MLSACSHDAGPEQHAPCDRAAHHVHTSKDRAQTKLDPTGVLVPIPGFGTRFTSHGHSPSINVFPGVISILTHATVKDIASREWRA